MERLLNNVRKEKYAVQEDKEKHGQRLCLLPLPSQIVDRRNEREVEEIETLLTL